MRRPKCSGVPRCVLTAGVFLGLIFTPQESPGICLIIPDPIMMVDTTVISSSETNTVVNVKYRTPIAFSMTTPDPFLKEKTVSTADMISELKSNFSNSDLACIGVITDVVPFTTDFNSEGKAYSCQRVHLTLDRVFKGDVIAGNYEFIDTLQGEGLALLTDSATGQLDTLHHISDPNDLGYLQLIDKKFLHFGEGDEQLIKNYALPKPGLCELPAPHFSVVDDRIEFREIDFIDSNNIRMYPLIWVSVETFAQHTSQLPISPGSKGRLIVDNPGAASGRSKEAALFTANGRRLPSWPGVENHRGAACGVYIELMDNQITQGNNLLHLRKD